MEISITKRNASSPEAQMMVSSDERTKVTIGIPAYNEKGRIGFLIKDLLSQVGPNIAEILVNVSGSTDGTRNEVLRVSRSRGKSYCPIRLLESKERLGKAAAIDSIIQESVGDILVFMDADTRVSPHCINRIVAPFLSDENVGAVSGNVFSMNEKNAPFSFVSNFQRELHHQICLRLMEKKLPPKVNGTFFAVRRKKIKKLPHEVISDDEYLSREVQNNGCKVVYVPDAYIYTMDPSNLRDYLLKRRRILGGHFLIRNTLGYTVPTTRIRLLLPEFGKLATKDWKNLFRMFPIVVLEFACWFVASVDASRRKVSPCYRIDSAK